MLSTCGCLCKAMSASVPLDSDLLCSNSCSAHPPPSLFRLLEGSVPPIELTNTTFLTPAFLAASICAFWPSQSTCAHPGSTDEAVAGLDKVQDVHARAACTGGYGKRSSRPHKRTCSGNWPSFQLNCEGIEAKGRVMSLDLHTVL